MRTKEEIDKLVEENIKLVHFVINKWYKQFKIMYPYLVEDLYQEGCIGLFNAARKYDESKGKFTTIATLCIKRRMENFIKRYVKKHYKNNLCNIEKTIYSDGSSDDIKLIDILADNGRLKDERIELVSKGIKNSDIKDIELIVKMTYEGYSQKDISQIVGITQANVSKRLKRFGDSTKALDELMIILYKNKAS